MKNQIVNKMLESHTLQQQLTTIDDSIQGLVAKSDLIDKIALLEDEITSMVNTYNRAERRLSSRLRERVHSRFVGK